MKMSERFEVRTRQGQPRQIKHVVIQTESRAIFLSLRRMRRMSRQLEDEIQP